MGFTSIWHWLIVLAIVLVLFGGRGKVSALMGDLGKGLKNFKKGMKDNDGSELGSDSDIVKSDPDSSTDTSNTDQAAKS